jgi:hypothetical protein
MPNRVKDDATMKAKLNIDWSRADAMTHKQRRAAARADPDNHEEWAAAPRVPRVSTIHRALKLRNSPTPSTSRSAHS